MSSLPSLPGLQRSANNTRSRRARLVARGRGREVNAQEVERAQWWFVGWRMAPTTLRHFMVTPRRKKADERLFVALREQAKEGGK